MLNLCLNLPCYTGNQPQVVIVCKPLVWQFILLLTSLQKHFDLLHWEEKLFVMEFKRDSAIYSAEKPQVDFIRALQHLNVKKSFISRTIDSYRDTGSVASSHKSGRKETVTTPKMIRKVKTRFDRNPRLSGRKIVRELNISRERMQHILKIELGLKPLKLPKVQELTNRQKKVRLERAKELLRLHESGQLPNLDFRWEAITNWVFFEQTKWSGLLAKEVSWKFTPAIGHQNTIAADGNGVGRLSLVFIDRAIKINALKTVLKYFCRKQHFKRTQHYCTQHASTKNRLKRRFFSSFPPHNGDLNLRISIRCTFAPGPLWRVRFSLKKYLSVDHQKTTLLWEWEKYRRATFVQLVMIFSAVRRL